MFAPAAAFFNSETEVSSSQDLLSSDQDDEEDDLDEYQARNTQQRRKTQFKKDRLKHSDRQVKLKAKIDRKKGGNKVHRLKVRKKWQKINKSKIANAQKVYGGKAHSKFTKKSYCLSFSATRKISRSTKLRKAESVMFSQFSSSEE